MKAKIIKEELYNSKTEAERSNYTTELTNHDDLTQTIIFYNHFKTANISTTNMVFLCNLSCIDSENTTPTYEFMTKYQDRIIDMRIYYDGWWWQVLNFKVFTGNIKCAISKCTNDSNSGFSYIPNGTSLEKVIITIVGEKSIYVLNKLES